MSCIGKRSALGFTFLCVQVCKLSLGRQAMITIGVRGPRGVEGAEAERPSVDEGLPENGSREGYIVLVNYYGVD